MEVRCESCGEVGVPANVDSGAEGGLIVECAHCGDKNLLSTADSTGESGTYARGSSGNLSLEEVIPEPGEGPRCPKCAGLVEESKRYCPNCGLDQSLAEKVGETPPWIDVENVPEEEKQRAKQLWGEYRRDGESETLDEFIRLTKRVGLEEWAIRKLRFWLGEYPDDSLAKQKLADLLDTFEKRLLGADRALQAERKSFRNTISSYREVLLVLTIVFWVLVTVVIIFWGA